MEPPIAHKPRPLRQQFGRHRKAVALHTDTYLRLKTFAQQHNLTWSGAIHELLRTHPLIALPSLLHSQQGTCSAADSLP